MIIAIQRNDFCQWLQRNWIFKLKCMTVDLAPFLWLVWNSDKGLLIAWHRSVKVPNESQCSRAFLYWHLHNETKKPMKTLLLILLVGYMIFGPTSKTKNENESLGIKSKDHTLSGSQKRFAVNGKGWQSVVFRRWRKGSSAHSQRLILLVGYLELVQEFFQLIHYSSSWKTKTG